MEEVNGCRISVLIANICVMCGACARTVGLMVLQMVVCI